MQSGVNFFLYAVEAIMIIAVVGINNTAVMPSQENSRERCRAKRFFPTLLLI